MDVTCTALVIAAGELPSKLDGPDEPSELGPAKPAELELPRLPTSPRTDSLPHSKYLHNTNKCYYGEAIVDLTILILHKHN